jgi:hypothetical protein
MRDACGPGFDIRDGGIERLRDLLGAAQGFDREAKSPRVRRIGRHGQECWLSAQGQVCSVPNIMLSGKTSRIARGLKRQRKTFRRGTVESAGR